MINYDFNFELPTTTDPYIEEHKWCRSKETAISYYVWVQKVVVEVQLHPALEPNVIALNNGASLTIYKGLSKQELLYRITFEKKPNRFLLRPNDNTIFWSFGSEGGASSEVMYLYKDKNISVHEWVDKNSYLADLRHYHYNTTEYAFWSR